MRRLLVLVISVALILLAAPAGAKRADKPPRPPAGLVDLSIEADLWAVNTAGDTISYTFTVTNRSNDELTDVAVRAGLADLDETILDETITLVGGETRSIERPYEVKPTDMGLPELVNTLTVTVGDLEETATATTPVWATDACVWEATGVEGVFRLAAIQTEYQPCRWTADQGYWTLIVTPTRTKPSSVQVTVRDHYPGNWCVAPVDPNTYPETGELIEPSGVLNQRIRGEVTVPVYFLGSGTCLAGGAGGVTMPVGTPGDYYLVAMGDIELTMTQGWAG
ncbi:MAG: hypothetical protein HKO82_11695 [Acidimicrobiia bacterium]|nr:hypothetical protein [Acidimicrobiia bacterium]MBT8247213.1 hypothetical protein [Acidimicrobiia bacterium]NNL14333.1 hypothetical protein [Acidimicrobiia bacterium]